MTWFDLFSMSTKFSSIWPIDRALSGLSGPGSEGSKGVLCIPQSSGITRALPSDFPATPAD